MRKGKYKETKRTLQIHLKLAKRRKQDRIFRKTPTKKKNDKDADGLKEIINNDTGKKKYLGRVSPTNKR